MGVRARPSNPTLRQPRPPPPVQLTNPQTPRETVERDPKTRTNNEEASDGEVIRKMASREQHNSGGGNGGGGHGFDFPSSGFGSGGRGHHQGQRGFMKPQQAEVRRRGSTREVSSATPVREVHRSPSLNIERSTFVMQIKGRDYTKPRSFTSSPTQNRGAVRVRPGRELYRAPGVWDDAPQLNPSAQEFSPLSPAPLTSSRSMDWGPGFEDQHDNITISRQRPSSLKKSSSLVSSTISPHSYLGGSSSGSNHNPH